MDRSYRTPERCVHTGVLAVPARSLSSMRARRSISLHPSASCRLTPFEPCDLLLEARCSTVILAIRRSMITVRLSASPASSWTGENLPRSASAARMIVVLRRRSEAALPPSGALRPLNFCLPVGLLGTRSTPATEPIARKLAQPLRPEIQAPVCALVSRSRSGAAPQLDVCPRSLSCVGLHLSRRRPSPRARTAGSARAQDRDGACSLPIPTARWDPSFGSQLGPKWVRQAASAPTTSARPMCG